MSYIRLTEERRYFPGESNIYAYPGDRDKNGNLLVHFDGDVTGSMKSQDFWELVIRSLEKTDIDNDLFWVVESAVADYYEKEQQMTENLTEEIQDD